jgi:cation diffusion facilitator family transporter
VSRQSAAGLINEETHVSGFLRGIRAAQAGLLINAILVIVKLIAGIVGNSYALIADAIESSTDIFSSLVVWSGLQVASRSADESHPYGHGKAEPLAAGIVSLMLIGAAVSIAIVAIREIVTPHHAPAPFTLGVIAVVIVVKEVLFRKVFQVGDELGSTAVKTDAWHHRSDAITSAAAFIGIAAAILGGPGWEAADDWAALVAAAIILFNGVCLLKPAVDDLMDRMPDGPIITQIEQAAVSVSGVLAIEKLRVRKFGIDYFVDLHVQADPNLSLHEAHIISGKVKSAIRQAVPAVNDTSIHMEPYEPPDKI